MVKSCLREEENREDNRREDTKIPLPITKATKGIKKMIGKKRMA